VATLINCIGYSHYHFGSSYITDPDFKLFGANLTKSESFYKIESYFRSSITGRTEYIYENFNLTFPIDIKQNQLLDASQFDIWYAKGGQGGQIETNFATGSFTVIKLSDKECSIDLNLAFSNFSIVGSFEKQNTIIRNGILTAKINYELY